MKAVVFDGNFSVRVADVPKAKIVDPLDVIVKVSLSGLCGSDLHLYTGREAGLDKGTIMGHEFVGVVDEVGQEVKCFAVGDRVVSPFSVCCGACFYCNHNLTARCEKVQVYGWINNGIGIQGAQTEYVRVPLADTTLMKIPESMSDDTALLLGDVFPTGFFCADNSGISTLKEKFPNDQIVAVVLGCGPVGLMALISALHLGASTVFAVDCVQKRLELAQKFGGIPINFAKEDPVKRVHEVTSNRGADVVLEAVGGQAVLKTAYKLARPGAVISSCGVQTEGVITGFTPVEGYDKNITYKSGRCSARFYMEKLYKPLQDGKFNIASIISHRVPLKDDEAVRKAYTSFNNREDDYTKVVFTY